MKLTSTIVRHHRCATRGSARMTSTTSLASVTMDTQGGFVMRILMTVKVSSFENQSTMHFELVLGQKSTLAMPLVTVVCG